MKTLTQRLNEAAQTITYKSFKQDVEKIITEAGFTITKDKVKTNPYVKYEHTETDNAYSFFGYHGPVDKYTFVYSYENDSSHKYGTNTNITESFQLVLYIWFNEELGRPQYIFQNFMLKYPEALGGGYDTQSNWIKFGSRRVESEYYEIVIRHITAVVRSFKSGKQFMDAAWELNGARKLIKNDFVKVCNKMFGKLVTKV